MKKLNIDKTYVIATIICIFTMYLFNLAYYTFASYDIALSNIFSDYKIYYILVPINLIYFIYKHNFKFKIYDYFILAYGLICIISTFTSSCLYQTLFGMSGRREGLFPILCYILMYFNFKNIDKKYYKSLLNSFIAVILLNVLYSVLQVFFDLSFLKYGSYFGRMAYGLIGNPNMFGTLCIIGTLLGIGLYLFGDNKKQSLLLFITSYIGLLLAESSGPFFSLGLTVILLVIFIAIKKQNIWKKVIKVLAILVLLYPCVLHTSQYVTASIYHDKYMTFITEDVDNIIVKLFNKITNHKSNDIVIPNEYEYVLGDKDILYIYCTVHNENKDLGSGRMQIWKGVMMLIEDKPVVGHGIETLFINTINTETGGSSTTNKAHNNYLEIWYSCGIFALLSYISWIGVLTTKGAKSNNKTVWILLFVFIGYSIQALFNISVINVAPYYYMIAGIMANLIERRK